MATLAAKSLRQLVHSTGLTRLYETATPLDSTVGPCLGSYGGAKGGGRSLMSQVPLCASRFTFTRLGMSRLTTLRASTLE